MSQTDVLLQELLEVARAQYIADLFVIGVVAGVFVVILLYKFLRLFF